MTAVS